MVDENLKLNYYWMSEKMVKRDEAKWEHGNITLYKHWKIISTWLPAIIFLTIKLIVDAKTFKKTIQMTKMRLTGHKITMLISGHNNSLLIHVDIVQQNLEISRHSCIFFCTASCCNQLFLKIWPFSFSQDNP